MAVTNILEDINQIAVTMATLDHSHMDSLYDALATRIAGTGAKDVAEAIESIKAAGEDPGKYIPVARSYQRQQQLAQRNALAQAEMEQRIRHAEELHQLELRRLASEVERYEAATSTVKATAAASV